MIKEFVLSAGFFGLLALALAIEATAAVVPAPPRLGSDAWLLADGDSGRILAQHNINARIPPASLTKIMTSYVVAYEIKEGRLDLESKVLVSKKAQQVGGSRMFLEQGSSVPLGDVLRGIIIQSGNDASIAMAEHIAGSEADFATLMNWHAQRLGLRQTIFINTTGLTEEGHATSAHDMYLLTRSLIYDFPDHYPLYSEKFFTYGKDFRTGEAIRQRNRNRLLWSDPSVDGVKTGHTEAAGYNLVASAKRQGMRLISVIMGARSDNSRTQDTQKLFTYGFRFFDTFNILEANQEIKPNPVVWGGEQSSVRIGTKRAVWVTVPKGQKDDLLAQATFGEDLWAPFEEDDQLGVLRVSLGQEVITEVPILALNSVEASGVIRRGVDFLEWSVIKAVKKLWDEIKVIWDLIW